MAKGRRGKLKQGAYVIEDERTRTSWSTKPCEQCGKTGMVRAVPVVGVMGEKRGAYYLCTECFGPRVHWVNADGKHYYTPVDEMTKDNIQPHPSLTDTK